MTEEVHAGLVREQKTLSPKFFYDKRGSDLFDAITELPEYYPTRTETGLLRQHKNELAHLFGKDSSLYELGSGSSTKIRLLLEAVRPKVYIPMDISREHLVESARRLLRDYPWLDIRAVHVDYSRPWSAPDFGPGHYNAFFPGSSIGNFEPDAALALLQRIKLLVAKGGGLLIGVDLKKDVAILEAAYNDRRGVTAEFNLNILAHINRRLEADFDLGNFAHRAFYHAEKGRIEMHLVSLREQQVRINGNVYSFKVGETIQTENSYKYSAEEFHQLAEKAGFIPTKMWVDSNAMFSLHYLVGR
jgi:dimethylhistidine N-methyltransferase